MSDEHSHSSQDFRGDLVSFRLWFCDLERGLILHQIVRQHDRRVRPHGELLNARSVRRDLSVGDGSFCKISDVERRDSLGERLPHAVHLETRAGRRELFGESVPHNSPLESRISLRLLHLFVRHEALADALPIEQNPLRSKERSCNGKARLERRGHAEKVPRVLLGCKGLLEGPKLFRLETRIK